MPKPRSIKQTLIAARELIADRSRWTQGVLARKTASRNSAQVAPNNNEAGAFCALGAISHVVGVASYPSDDGKLAKAAAKRLEEAAGEAGVVNLNDYGPRAKAHAKVLAAYDEAIAKCR